ncbi:hypothetical protein LV780_04725 [Cereibacter azotoformans]|uniref:hypothetical protein n=1 Tax=Cereibacter azotoformans TaxID=43057 RepID=UPI0015F317A2|nr:hypothetical protein [Cereibacter azotoformans]UIJ31485.1 hypothetical protein LV780_04725 [Cereibacter azotoformans]
MTAAPISIALLCDEVRDTILRAGNRRLETGELARVFGALAQIKEEAKAPEARA